jgi:hypothetical protein
MQVSDGSSSKVRFLSGSPALLREVVSSAAKHGTINRLPDFRHPVVNFLALYPERRAELNQQLMF